MESQGKNPEELFIGREPRAKIINEIVLFGMRACPIECEQNKLSMKIIKCTKHNKYRKGISFTEHFGRIEQEI